MRKKITLLDARRLAKLRGGFCLAQKMVTARTKIQWQCNKDGNIWSATYDHIRRGQWCPQCGKNKKLTIQDCKKVARDYGIKLLTKTFRNARTKMLWQCRGNHRWWAAVYSIKSGRLCRVCGGKERLTLSEMQAIASERGGKCLSKRYKNARSYLLWQCGEGHRWRAKPVDIKSQGTWCGECGFNYKGEKICRAYFEAICKSNFPKSRPLWLKNKNSNQFELDGYCKKLGIAFEHHGKQHYQKVGFWQGKVDFEKRKKDDQEKIKLCKKRGITLIVVPEIPRLTKIDQLDLFILKELKKKGLNFKKPKKINLKKIFILDSETHLSNLKKIIKKRGGKLLSENYLGAHFPLLVICSKDHQLLISPSNLKAGKWCRRCYMKNHG